MNTCKGKCDCDSPSAKHHGPHDPNCRSLDKCEGERGIWCEKHWREKLHELGWMSGLVGNCGGSTYVQTEDRMRQDMIDAIEAICSRTYWLTGIDMARMRAKAGL